MSIDLTVFNINDSDVSYRYINFYFVHVNHVQFANFICPITMIMIVQANQRHLI